MNSHRQIRYDSSIRPQCEPPSPHDKKKKTMPHILRPLLPSLSRTLHTTDHLCPSTEFPADLVHLLLFLLHRHRRTTKTCPSLPLPSKNFSDIHLRMEVSHSRHVSATRHFEAGTPTSRRRHPPSCVRIHEEAGRHFAFCSQVGESFRGVYWLQRPIRPDFFFFGSFCSLPPASLLFRRRSKQAKPYLNHFVNTPPSWQRTSTRRLGTRRGSTLAADMKPLSSSCFTVA